MDRINELTKDCFNAIHQLRTLGEGTGVTGEVVHRRLIGYLEQVRDGARAANVPERDANEMVYALAALADEIALSKGEAIRSYWYSHPLQLQLFNENVAGEGFFKRLDALRSDKRRIDVLRVYYLCLLFGFQGKYAMRGGELELLKVQESIKGELDRALDVPDDLSPHGLPEDDEALSRRGRRRLHLWIALGALAASMAVYIGLRVALDRRVQSVAAEVTPTQPGAR